MSSESEIFFDKLYEETKKQEILDFKNFVSNEGKIFY
jgi:hypothetical protein